MLHVRPVIFAAIVVCFAPVAAAQDAPLRLNRVEVRDPVMGGEVAFTLLAPDGWRTEASVEWRLHQSNLAVIHARVSTPDGRILAEVFPVVPCAWIEGAASADAVEPGATLDGDLLCPPMTDPADYVGNAILPVYRDDVRIELAERERLRGVERAVAAALSLPGGSQVAAERLRGTYEHENVQYDEDFYVALVFAAGPPTEARRTVRWRAEHQFAFSAPEGELDDATPLLHAIAASIRVEPAWFAQYQQAKAAWLADRVGAIRTPGDLAAVVARRADELRTLHERAWEDQLRTRAAAHAAFAAIPGRTTTWRDPATQRNVLLPDVFAAVWFSDAGGVALSADPAYEPAVEGGTIWTPGELEQATPAMP